jgi:hypothetical protein
MLIRRVEVSSQFRLRVMAWRSALGVKARFSEPLDRRLEDMTDPLSAESLYADVVKYASMGEHRTASSVDLRTSRWICEELCAAGIDARCAPWQLRQFQLQECWISAYGQRIEAFPLWHPTSAGRSPISGELVRAGGSESVAGRIALVQFADNMVTATSSHADIVASLADAGATAIVGCTPHASGAVYGQNAFAPHNQTPWPLPVVMIAPSRWHVLAHAAQQGDPVSVMLSGSDEAAARAENVIGTLPRGRCQIIVSTPQSGWFRSAGERGGGVALLLGVARWAASVETDASFTFLSTSGHEIGHMGIHALMKTNVLPCSKDTMCWLHLGASIATRGWSEAGSVLEPCGPEPVSWLFASGDMLRHTANGFRELSHLVPEVYDRDHGEIRWILEAGYSAYALMGPHRFFHLADDGPEVIEPDLLAEVGQSIIRTFDSVLGTAPGAGV